MANLGSKGGANHARSRLGGKEYKKSPKIRNETVAGAVPHMIEFTLHRLHTGQIRVPEGSTPETLW